MKPRAHRRSACSHRLAALALLAVVGGCASLDPSADINRAASTIAERSGVTPTWTEPWESSLTSWDGRTPLRVEQAVAMALRNNREIRSEVEQIAATRADLVQAGLLPNPVLGLTLRFPFDPVSGGTFIGAQVVQSFTALWLRDDKIKAADARLNQTVLDVSDKALRLVAGVKATHARIAFGHRAVAIADGNLATFQQTIDSLESRVRAGEGAPLDVNRARQQLANAEARRAIVIRDLARDRRRLLELIGFASESAEWTAEADTSVTATFTPDEAAAVELARSQRLDVAAARAIVEAQRAGLSVEEASRLKDFGLGADFERSESGDKSIGPVVEVSIPIFDTNEAQIAKAGSLARAALANYEAVSQRAVREARVAWVELDSASRLVEQYRSTALGISERNLTLAEAALKAGQADVTVLLEAQREQIDARRTLIDLERDAALARISLEQAVGGRLVRPDSSAREPAFTVAGASSSGMVFWVGEMHRTIMEGKIAGQVRLVDLLVAPGLNAVGPVEGLTGEITVIDGVAHVGEVRDNAFTSSQRADASAPFLVWANVREWSRQPLPSDALTSASLEARLPGILGDAGFDPAQPVPFRIEGVATTLSFHVLHQVTGDAPGGEAHDRAKVHGEIADVPVQLVGFYSEEHRGVFTPGSSDFHIHFVTDGARSGHVEAFELHPGATLLLPRP